MASTSKTMGDGGMQEQTTVLVFGIRTAVCDRYPRCGCTDGSCGRAAEKNGHLKCGLDGKISLARAEVKEAQKNAEHARMAFSEAIKTLRGIPRDSPQYGPARAHRSLMQKTHDRLEARAEETRGVLSALITSLKHIEDREQAQKAKTEQSGRKAWAKTCQKSQPEILEQPQRPIRIRTRGAVRSPCGILCSGPETAQTHAFGCEDCKRITQITEA